MKSNSSFRKKEFKTTIAMILVVFLVGFFGTGVVTFLSEKKSTEEVCRTLFDTTATATDGLLAEIDANSKEVFYSEEFASINYNELSENQYESKIISYLDEKYSVKGSYLVRGFGYIPLVDDEFRDDLFIISASTIFVPTSSEITKIFNESVQNSNEVGYKNGRNFIIQEFHSDIVVFGRLIKDVIPPKYDEPRGIGIVFVNRIALYSFLTNSSNFNGFSFMLQYDDKTIFGDSNIIEQSSVDIYFSTISQSYKLYGVFDRSVIIGKTFLTILFEFVAFVFLTGIFIFTYIYLHRKSEKSFSYLVNSFEKYGNINDLSLINPTENDKEINKVIETYNKMASRFIYQVNKNEKLLIKKQEAEIDSLYSQINKHFTINVLSIIHSLISLGKHEDANFCLENLSDYLRYTLSFSVKFTSFKEEIKILEAYFDLQKLRYPEVKTKIEADDELLDIQFPKMCIQPLIENAYVHGIVANKGEICVCISKKEDRITIDVVNTGRNIPETEIQKLNKKITQNLLINEQKNIKNNGVALCNIKKRLDLFFGDSSLYLENVKNGIRACIEVKISKGRK